MTKLSRKTFATISLSALVSNYKYAASLAPKSETIAVIKANAYGHGAVDVAKCLSLHVPAFAVAFIDEAIELRDAGITQPILILEGALSQHDYSIALKQNFWMMIHNIEQVSWLQTLTTSYSEKLWLKVDTGMNRLGIVSSEVNHILSQLSPNQLDTLVLCTHFSSSDELDNNKTQLQIKQFEQINQQHKFAKSLSNSAAILKHPQSHGDYNRLGIALYGSNPLFASNQPIPITAAMTLQSTVIGLRDLNIGDSVGYGETWQAHRPSTIATIAIGYADGYPRNAKAGTPVYINGKIAPIAGRVSMDMITIDVTDIDNVALGDSVELWGKNLTIETVAEHLDTINYELLTRVSKRVTRIYID
jgi:alanine racemase